MNHIQPSAPGPIPWRILLLDRDPSDPRWLLAALAVVSDVRPARLDLAGRYLDWRETCAWVRAQTGRAEVSLIPVCDALAWHVDETCKPEGERS